MPHPILPSVALFAALGRFGSSARVALLSPFSAAGHQRAIGRLTAAGFNVVADATLDASDPADVAGTSFLRLRALYDQAVQRTAVDVVVQLGHNLPMGRLVDNLEEDFARPLLAINHVCLWHMLREGGVNDLAPGAGRLFMDF